MTMLPKLTNNEAIEAQLHLEEFSMEEGIRKYRKVLLEEGIESLTPGKQLLKAALKPMVDALQVWKDETKAGLASRNASTYYFVDQLDMDAVAWITASICLSRLHEQPKVANVASAIAMRMEQTLNHLNIAKDHPSLAAKIAKAAERMKDNKNRMLFIRRGAELVDVKVVAWDDATRVRVGTLLIEMFIQATGLVVAETVILGKSTKPMYLRPTESCRQWLEESHARCELLAPVRLPMVCMPRNWTTPFNGGYLTKEMRQPIVKTRNRGYLTTLKDWDMPWVYAAVNALQDTEWAVNRPVYEVVKAIWEESGSYAGVPSRQDIPLPSRSWEEGTTPDPAYLNAWKVDAAKTYEANTKLQSKRGQLVQKMYTAELLMERGNRFHFVYNLDWRGRIYPIAPALSPQGDDVAKGLLTFSNTHPLGDDGAYWLAIHGANCFGVDKVSFEERIKWVEENESLILRIARDPMMFAEWADADSPFVFLAFCFEYAKLDAWVQAGNDQSTFESSIPLAFDGACNGLQNFSAMLRDPIGGKATGLVPSGTPSDIYSEVARATQAIIDKDATTGHVVAQRWVGKMTRKLAKRNTMTVPYGVTKRGMRDQLFGELTSSEGRERAEDAEYLSAANFDSIGKVVVAARLAMDWLREAAKVAAKNGLPVRWVTPSGFLAVQDYREELGQRLDFDVLGRRYTIVMVREGDKLNSRKQALGISPNYVHSLDAAHLMRTVMHCAADGMTSFAMIHDSYGCHAGHATRLRDNLRVAFVEQYSGNVLERFRNELLEQLPEDLKGELPPLPPMGDLDLEQVKTSEYFFA